MLLKAARTSLLLCVLFCIVYGATNYAASRRTSVGTANFAWESRIPFVPLFIVPYMSINCFFVTAPFLCRTDAQRRTFFWRITTALLIAGLIFLIFPLRFAFERPPVTGWLGFLFNRFREYDRPFNEFPSLHVAFSTILAAFYLPRSRGPLRFLLALWFILIVLSAVLTYQHHTLDVLGGFALAALCIRFLPNAPAASAAPHSAAPTSST